MYVPVFVGDSHNLQVEQVHPCCHTENNKQVSCENPPVSTTFISGTGLFPSGLVVISLTFPSLGSRMVVHLVVVDPPLSLDNIKQLIMGSVQHLPHEPP